METEKDFIIENGTLQKYYGSQLHVVIPKGVTTVWQFAFMDCVNLEKLTVSEGVKTVYRDAFFNCTTLTEIEISSTVTNISKGVFSSCPNLKRLTVSEDNPAYRSIDGNLYTKDGSKLLYSIPHGDTVTVREGVKHIESLAFSQSKVKTVILPEGVTEIGEMAFYNCHSLETVKFPESLQKIEKLAFYNCTALKSAVLPKNLGSLSIVGVKKKQK